MDMTFAISSTASQSDDTFRRMKDVIKYIYDEYGFTRTRFSIIVFADTARTLVRFDENIRVYDKKMIELITSLPRSQGGSNINAALSEANRGFDNSDRPDSRKVLVIITDKASGRSLSDIKRQAKPLMDKNVFVIPVSVGDDSSIPELEQTTHDKRNLIKKPDDLDPAKTGQEIIEKIDKGLKPGGVYSYCNKC